MGFMPGQVESGPGWHGAEAAAFGPLLNALLILAQVLLEVAQAFKLLMDALVLILKAMVLPFTLKGMAVEAGHASWLRPPAVQMVHGVLRMRFHQMLSQRCLLYTSRCV